MIGEMGPSFTMFSASHSSAIGVIVIVILGLAICYKKKIQFGTRNFERVFAGSLLSIEWLYYAWMYWTGKWSIHYSLPLELCSISLYAAIILLWTNNWRFYPFVFFAGIGGAVQAILTPDLELGFPHFRYFQFFYVHGGIIFTAVYFTWIKGYRPNFRNVMETMIILNGIAIIVYMINLLVEGNYMFLRMKPEMGSLLDYLGPHPYYILSLEGIAFFIFLSLWLLFRK